jgi:carbamate kinase
MEQGHRRVVAIPSTESTWEAKVSSKNIVAAIVIIVVIIGGGAALYKMDDGRGARTSSDITAKTASD